MKTNRILALLLSLVLALTLTACGNKPAEPTPAPDNTPAVSESVAPTPDGVTTPVESVEPEQTPDVPDDVHTTPIQTPNGSSEELSSADIWNVVSAGRDLPAFMDLDDDLLSDIYGIDPADLVDYTAKIPMMNVHATEFFIAKVQIGKMDAVKGAIKARQADLENQWASYLPDQLELVKNYELVENGDYIMFAISEDAAEMVKSFNDCTK